MKHVQFIVKAKSERWSVAWNQDREMNIGKEIPAKRSPIIQIRGYKRQRLQLKLEEAVGADDDGPPGRGVDRPRARKLAQDSQEGGWGDARARVVEDVRVVAGDDVREARPGRGDHVPTEHHVAGPELLEEAQVAAIVDRNQLEQVHVDLQRGDDINGEPESVQDAAGVSKLSE